MKKGSSVILISSIGGYHVHDSLAMYGVTKTALFGLTKVSSSCALRSYRFHQELDKSNSLKYDDELEVITLV
jgi:NAD(P)-dependent dehydrogenase (short-subunit alcohol dehydrogenase family)